MQALLVVDFLQEFPNRSLSLLQIVVLRAVDFLVFEGLDKTLRSGIVVGRCGSAHADANVALFQLCRVVVRSILHTTGQNGAPSQALAGVASVPYARTPAPAPLPRCAAMPSRCSVAKRRPAEPPDKRTLVASGCR